MNKEELIESYIYAVTRYLKKAEREDIGKELHSIIEDMIEEQYPDKEPNEYQIKAILSELGTPLALYEKYSQEGSDCLIGAPYFGIYKSMIKLVSICVIFGMLLAGCITVFTQNLIWYEAIATVFANIFGGLLSGFAIVTLIFAFFYKKQVKIEGVFDSLDNLPKIPEKKTSISPAAGIWGIVVSVLFTTVFLIYPQILCTVNVATKEVIPIFNVDYIRSTWYLLLIFAALGITREIMKIVEGQYTKRLLLVTGVTDGLSALFTIIWLKNDIIINPAFGENLNQIFDQGEAWLLNMMMHFNMFFMAVILFALALDFVVTLSKTEK